MNVESIILGTNLKLSDLRQHSEEIFDLMADERKPKKDELAYYSAITPAMWAVHKARGPIVIIPDDAAYRLWTDTKKIKVRTPVPRSGFIAIRMKGNKDEKTDRWELISFQLETSLPWDMAPVARGYPYFVVRETVWNNDRHNLATYVTVNPETGHLALCNRRIATRYGVHWKPDPWWSKPLQAEGCPMVAMLPWAFDAENAIDSFVQFSATREVPGHKRWPLRIRVPIELSRAKSLFSGRDKTAAVTSTDGRRKPIFHWTASHHRTIYAKPRNWLERILWRLFPKLRKVSKVVPVKTHLKGVQDFQLDGMPCSLDMPRRDIGMNAESDFIVGVDWSKSAEEWAKKVGDDALSEVLVDKAPAGIVFKPKWYAPFLPRKSA